MRGSKRRDITAAALLAAALVAGPAEGSQRRQARLPHGVPESLDRAEAKLRRGACAAIFREFHDPTGRPLAAGLDTLGLKGHEFLNWLTFAPGDNFRKCQDPAILAFTAPGDRVVYVCETRFLYRLRRDPEGTAHTLIHEAMHALGLGENPPSSLEITEAVSLRCRD